MGYFANQKTITINKPQLERDDVRIILKKDSVEEAARDLTGNEFKLYIYLASNSDNYKLDFSPKYFGSIYGIGADTARKLMKNLEEKEYLVPKEKDGNLYNFYMNPQKKMKIKVPRRRIVDEDGVVYELTYEELCKELEGYSKTTIDKVWNSGEELD